VATSSASDLKIDVANDKEDVFPSPFFLISRSRKKIEESLDR